MENIFDDTKIKENSKFKLSDFSNNKQFGLSGKTAAKKILEQNRIEIAKEADKLYANKKNAVLLIIQAMDAAKKDSTIKHVFKEVPPQITKTADFKEPSSTELKHDYIWRIYKSLPERGEIGIFNRSQYEEVITTQVHPELIINQNIPGMESTDSISETFWDNRYEQIRNFEKHLSQNGYTIIKVFLHMSKEKQRKRFLRRIKRNDKHWKFAFKDVEERAHWDQYMKSYETAIRKTSTEFAPWHVVPADRKWIIRAVVSELMVHYLNSLELTYPALSKDEQQKLEQAKNMLLNENDHG